MVGGYVVLVLVAAAVADRRFGPRPPPPLTQPHGCGPTNSQSHTAASCPPRPPPPPQSRFLFSSSHTPTSHVRRPLGRARNGAAATADGKSEGSLLSAQPRGPAAPPPPLPPPPVPSPRPLSVLSRSAGTTQMFQTTSKTSGCDEHIRTPSDVSDMPAALKRKKKKKSGRLWPCTNLCLRQRPQEPKLEPLT